MKEIQTDVWKEIDFKYQNESNKFAIFDYFRFSVLRCLKKMQKMAVEYHFKCDKMSIYSLMDGTQQVIFQRSRFDRQDNANLSIFSAISAREISSAKILTAKIIIAWYSTC